MSCNKRNAIGGEDQPNNTGTEGPTALKVATATLTPTLHCDEESDEESDEANDDEDSRPFKKARYLDPDACMYCDSCPCLWVQYTEGLMFDADFYCATHGYEEGDSTANHLVRKHLYGKFIFMHHGIGNPCIPIPDCVTRKIWFLFPEPDKKNMGFKAQHDKDDKGVK